MNAHFSVYVDEGRYNLYATIHKGLRAAQTKLLARLGALDTRDDPEMRSLADDLGRMILLGRKHLMHENVYIHSAIEARLPGGTSRLADDHDHHERDFDILDAMIAALRSAPVAERAPLARALYLRYSQFLAEDFEHMLEEETETLSQLHRLFSDAELQAIEMNILGSVQPDLMLEFLRIMIPSMNPDERIGMVGGMKASMPQPVFAAILDAAVRPVLTNAQFKALAKALAIPG